MSFLTFLTFLTHPHLSSDKKNPPKTRHEGYTIDGKPWIEKLKHEDYAEEIVEFKRILSRIGKKHGWTLEDIQKRFSNELFDGLIYDL